MESLGILASSCEVLIVDDSTQYARILTKMLYHLFGFETVTHIASPEEALVKVCSEPQRWKILFIDYNFPSGFSGVSLLEELNSKGLLGEQAVFLVTSAPSAENVKAAVAAGAFGIIAKPFDQNELRRQLENAARRIDGKGDPGF
jgi:response regulator of citrate/malate metabolism